MALSDTPLVNKFIRGLEPTGRFGPTHIDTRFTSERSRQNFGGFDLVTFTTDSTSVSQLGLRAFSGGPVIDQGGKLTPLLNNTDFRPAIQGFTSEAQSILQEFLPSSGGFTQLSPFGFFGPTVRENTTGRAATNVLPGAPGGGSILNVSPTAKTLGVQKSPQVLAEERRRRNPASTRSNQFVRSGNSVQGSTGGTDLLGQKTILG